MFIIFCQNLPLPFKLVLGGPSETFPWQLTSKTFNSTAKVCVLAIGVMEVVYDYTHYAVHARFMPFLWRTQHILVCLVPPTHYRSHA